MSETEVLIIAAQDQVLWTNYFKRMHDKSQNDPKINAEKSVNEAHLQARHARKPESRAGTLFKHHGLGLSFVIS